MIKSALACIALALPLAAQAASDLDVLPQGRYGCWTAGSASGPAVHPQSEFTVVRVSSYRSEAVNARPAQGHALSPQQGRVLAAAIARRRTRKAEVQPDRRCAAERGARLG